MAKYGPKAQEKVEKVMKERKRGTLRSGSGQKVKSRKQAIAIGLSEARRAGGKVPSPKRSKKSSGGTSKRGRKKTTRTAKSRRKTTRKTASSSGRKRARSRR